MSALSTFDIKVNLPADSSDSRVQDLVNDIRAVLICKLRGIPQRTSFSYLDGASLFVVELEPDEESAR